MIYKRVAQTFPESGVDPAAWTLPNGSQAKALCFQDVNSLYPAVMRSSLPVGRPLVYTGDSESGFKKKPVKNRGDNSSPDSFEWLNMMQAEFTEPIQCALNGDEVQIGNFRLDGFVYQNGLRIGLDYNGCRWHPCDLCSTPFVGGDDLRKRHFDRAEFLEKNLDKYITIKECEFKRQPQTHLSLLSCFFKKQIVTTEDFLNAVVSGKFTGVAKIDIITPIEKQEKWLKLNHPPLAVKREITREMIHPELRDKLIPGKKPQLTLGFHESEMVIASPLLRYYLEQGLKVTKLYWFAEYSSQKPFRPFIDSLVARRVAATKTKNSEQSELSKLLMNSSWGRLCMNLSKRRNSIYCRQSEISAKTTLHTKSCQNLVCEYPVDLFEMSKEKKSQTDRIPVTCALFILQLSKLHMLKYLDFLLKYMRPGTWELVYQDTDSYLFQTQGKWDDLVREPLRAEYEEAKFEWYLRNDSAEEQRSPGKVLC